MELTHVDEGNLESIRFRGDLITVLMKYKHSLNIDKRIPCFVMADYIENALKSLNEAFVTMKEFDEEANRIIPDVKELEEFGGTESI